jgi:hypothetical protein
LRGVKVGVLKDRLSELADYRKIHGTACSQPLQRKYQVGRCLTKGSNKLHLKGKTSSMTTYLPFQELESLGFEWGQLRHLGRRLSELADYRKIQALQCSQAT